MSRALKFSDVLIALLPEGSLWSPAETEFSYGSEAYDTTTFTAAGVLEVGNPAPTLGYQPGDHITITGSVSNDGTYALLDVEREYILTVDGTFVPEVDAVVDGATLVTVERKVNAGTLLRMLLGMGDNHQTMRDFFKELAYIRDPKLTPILSDLEKEYGRLTDPALLEQDRRDILHEIVYAPRGTGAASYLQAQLQSAGFSVYVYQNSPAYDPGAFYGGPGGELITNNILYDRTIIEATQDQDLWPHVFFIGGTAIRDDNGRIIHIEPVIIPAAQKSAFRTTVLKCKPTHSWCVAVINSAGYFTFSVDDNVVTDTAKGFANVDHTTGGFWYDGELSTWVYQLIDDTSGDPLVDESGDYLVDG